MVLDLIRGNVLLPRLILEADGNELPGMDMEMGMDMPMPGSEQMDVNAFPDGRHVS